MEIYVVFTCDEWKSHTSMRYRGTFSNIANLKNYLIDMEDKGEIELRYQAWDEFDACGDAEEICAMFTYLHIEEDNLDMIY